jgi:putative transposase
VIAESTLRYRSRREPRTALRLRIREIAQVRVGYGYRKIRALLKREGCDNGTEFTSQTMDLWAYHAGVRIDFSRPGKPTDNAYVESFNGTLRMECLDAHWFGSLAEAKEIIEAWRKEYNESRPHRAHGERTPHEIAGEFAASREFTSTQTTGDSLSG